MDSPTTPPAMMTPYDAPPVTPTFYYTDDDDEEEEDEGDDEEQFTRIGLDIPVLMYRVLQRNQETMTKSVFVIFGDDMGGDIHTAYGALFANTNVYRIGFACFETRDPVRRFAFVGVRLNSACPFGEFTHVFVDGAVWDMFCAMMEKNGVSMSITHMYIQSQADRACKIQEYFAGL